jgi:EAL domain-containing protein (putative c-di-GMP-specific phosphodiesterase class I)/GGDEF domain-containing protein
MDLFTRDDLNRQSVRMTRGYVLALVCIGVASLFAYQTLRTTLQQQQQLNQLHVVSGNLQLTLRDTFDRTQDFKDVLREERPRPRLVRQISDRVRSELELLNTLHAEANKSLELLGIDSASQQVAVLFYEPPFNLNQRVNAFSSRVESMLADTDAVPSDSTLYWLPVDAVAAESGYLSKGYRLASDATKKLLDEHNAQIEQAQKRLLLLIAGVLLVVTLLIFRPILRGLRRVHARVVEAQGELEYLAFHDPLTGLNNTAGAKRHSDQYDSLLIIRIRNMAAISNVIGAADEARFLELFANTVKAIFRESDLIARTGGDEFAVLTTNRLQTAPADLYQRIHTQTSRLVVGGAPVYVDIGMGWDELTACEFTECLANARLAERSYQPSAAVAPRFQKRLRAELEVENHTADRIREGMENGCFKPFYQLKVATYDWQPQGMEALCRWIEPDGTVIPPGEFIPIAERKGLIVDITWQLIAQVIEDQIKWKAAGLYCGAVAVNLAEAVLRDQCFAKKFATAMSGVDEPSRFIELEITENIALSGSVTDIERSLDVIRDAGLSIALDDFGTGFASLSSVVDLDIDIIKIDRSFVKDMLQNEKSRAVVEGILSICKTLNKKSVVEGVENIYQANELLDLGADQIQGFFFHKPAPFDSIVATLQSWTHKKAA